MSQYIQTIDITSVNFYCSIMVDLQIRYGNKQYFTVIDDRYILFLTREDAWKLASIYRMTQMEEYVRAQIVS